MRGTLPLAILLACVCVLVGRCTVKIPEPDYPVVTVTRPVYLASKPDTIVRWKDEIVTRIVKADQIAIAPHAEDSTVSTFCKAANLTLNDSTVRDSALVLPMLFSAGTYDGKKLKLFEARADGSGAIEDFKARAPLSFAIKDGRALVKSSRLWWVKPAIKYTAMFGAGYVAGHYK